MKRVSFQGELGAYSESAAISFFNEKIETYILLDEFKAIEKSRAFKDDHFFMVKDPKHRIESFHYTAWSKHSSIALSIAAIALIGVVTIVFLYLLIPASEREAILSIRY